MELVVPSQKHHFWQVGADNKGILRLTNQLAYNELVTFYDHSHMHKACSETGIVYTYKNNYWAETHPLNLEAFVIDNVDNGVDDTKLLTLDRHRREFVKRMQATNITPLDWFSSDILSGKINLKNGVLDIISGELLKQGPKYPFRYILPYDHDPKASCPKFVKFLKDVTCNRQDLEDILVEYMGYCLAGGPCKAEKALFLTGSGSNGKSTFVDIIKEAFGKENYSSLSLGALNKDTKRLLIDGKLVNIGEETSTKSLIESNFFKTMVTGGEVDVKKLYAQDFVIKNRCKLIVLCNEMPISNDRTDGLYRRMLVVPFDAKFKGENRNPFIKEEICKDELSGILNLVCKGYKRLVEKGNRFKDSDVVSWELKKYKMDNDNVLLFLHDRIDIISSDDKNRTSKWIAKEDLWNGYKQWCVFNNNKPFSGKKFWERLKNSIPHYETPYKKLDEFIARKRVVTGIYWKLEE